MCRTYEGRERNRGVNIKRSEPSREWRASVFLWQNQSRMEIITTPTLCRPLPLLLMLLRGFEVRWMFVLFVMMVSQCFSVPQTDERAAYRINSQVCQMRCCINNCFISNYSQQCNVSACQCLWINKTMLQGVFFLCTTCPLLQSTAKCSIFRCWLHSRRIRTLA